MTDATIRINSENKHLRQRNKELSKQVLQHAKHARSLKSLYEESKAISAEYKDMHNQVEQQLLALQISLGWQPKNQLFNGRGRTLLVKINGKPYVAKLNGFQWEIQCFHSNSAYLVDWDMVDEWKEIEGEQIA